MKKSIVLASLLVVAVSLHATQYPDSVRQASAEEPNIAYGWNFEFGGGAGVGSYTYQQLFAKFSSPHVTNMVHYPTWHGAFGLSYYFVPWMGIGTGVQFSAYVNNAAVNKPWVLTAKDPFNDEYVMTSTPSQLSEYQNIYMLEVPIAFKFRYRPGVVGLTATAGMKLGLPMKCSYQLSPNGVMNNSVYYQKYDLTIRDVPTVVENLSIPSSQGTLAPSAFKSINYAAYAELGMLIRLHQRVELAIAAYATYYVNDVMASHPQTNLGFADGRTAGEYPLPYTEAYNGVLRTNEVETLHPWSAGLKIGIQINANRTKAQRDYDREQRRLRKLEKARQDSLDALVPDTLPTVEETIQEELTADTVEAGDSVEMAIRQIMDIAERYGINLCEDICAPIPVFVHDTIYVPSKMKDSVAAVLDEELQRAVIYFDLDKAIPILQPTDILVRIAEVLKRHPNQKIHVNGHACRLGKPGYNKRLAMRRAKAVAAQLRELGVRDDQMIIASLGSEVPYRYNGKHQLSKDRRVEIVPVGRTTERVRPGSRLAQIARRHYGNPEYWVYIYEANRDKISNPSELPVGIELDIPDLSEIKKK